MKVTGDFELHPLLLEDLKRVHEELRANGELRSREALEGFYATFYRTVARRTPSETASRPPPPCSPPGFGPLACRG